MDNSKIIGWMKKMQNSLSNRNFLFFLGVLGIGLIFLSDIFSHPEQEKPVQSEWFQKEAYLNDLENKLENIISSISGAGKVQVMITLEGSPETVYVFSEKSEHHSEKQQSETQREQTRYQNEYIFVENPEGKKQALEKTVLEPQIKGVAIICQGGANIQVINRITETVSVLLGISSNRICVTKMI